MDTTWYCHTLGSQIYNSSNGNIFRVTDPLWRDFTGDPWNPSAKACGAELWCFRWSGLNKRLSKHSRRRWFEMLSRSSWRHFYVMPLHMYKAILRYNTNLAELCQPHNAQSVSQDFGWSTKDLHNLSCLGFGKTPQHPPNWHPEIYQCHWIHADEDFEYPSADIVSRKWCASAGLRFPPSPCWDYLFKKEEDVSI